MVLAHQGSTPIDEASVQQARQGVSQLLQLLYGMVGQATHDSKQRSDTESQPSAQLHHWEPVQNQNTLFDYEPMS